MDYIANTVYNVVNIFNTAAPEPSLYITDDDEQVIFYNYFGIAYKTVYLPINTRIELELLKNSKLQVLELQSRTKEIKDYNKVQAILDNLPKTLNKLSLTYYNTYSNTYSNTSIENDISERNAIKYKLAYNNLPSNLIELNLTIPEMCQSLDNLPTTNLQKLLINCNYFDIDLKCLPQTLKVLHLECANFNKPLDNLPSQLEEFYLNSNSFNHSLNNLPNSIKTLKLYLSNIFDDNHEYVIDKLPGNLETLHLKNNRLKPNTGNKYIINTLPIFIRIVVIINVCVHNINHLEKTYPHVCFEYFGCEKLV